MNNKISISELINQFKETEGETFAINEQAIIAETVEQAANKTTVSITVLSILGGFFATLAFIAFLLLVGLYDSEEGLLIFGFLLVAASVGINKAYNKVIIDTVSVSAFMAGFCMVGFGLMELEVDERLVCLIFMLSAIVILVINQSFLLSLFSFGIVFGSIIFLIYVSNVEYVAIYIYLSFLAILLTAISVHESFLLTRARKFAKLYQPLHLALVCTLIASFQTVVIQNEYYSEEYVNYSWLLSCASILPIIYTLTKILQLYSIKDNNLQKGIIYAGTTLLLLPTFYAPAISCGLLILLISYLVNNRVTLVMGIVSFIHSIVVFYYNLGYTLLQKSIILFVTGILFLIAYMLFVKKIKSDEKI